MYAWLELDWANLSLFYIYEYHRSQSFDRQLPIAKFLCLRSELIATEHLSQ